MWIIVFIKIKEVVIGLMMQGVEVGIKISVTPPFTMMDKLFMVMV